MPACLAEELRWLVLDEADRLLDLGFEKKISEVGGRCVLITLLRLWLVFVVRRP